MARFEKPSFKRDLLATLPSLRAFRGVAVAERRQGRRPCPGHAGQGVGQAVELQPGTNLKAWLFTILRNEFYSQMRKRGREVQDSDGPSDRSASPCIRASPADLDLDDFRRALEQLPEDQREAIILIGASGFSYEEAAEICKCAVGTIKSRVSRARTRLQEILDISGEADYGPDAIAAQVMGSTVS
jgi:RNA polymerase sigma-70 factor (ECF subfamily)